MNFRTRPHFEDRQLVQYNDESIKLSGITYIGPTLLDFTGTTTAQTSVNIMGLTGYLNEGRDYGFVVNPPILKVSGGTGYTTVDVTGWVLTAYDADGTVYWSPNVSADTNTFVTGGTLSGTTLILNWNTGGSASPISLYGLVFTGNTSGTCINDLYVKKIHSCSPLEINPNDEGNVYFGSTSGFTVDLIGGGNTYTRGNHLVHSDSLLNISDIPSNFENLFKGSYTQFNWDGLAANIITNNNPSGNTSVIFGNLSTYPTRQDYGFVSYYGSGFTRGGSPATGLDFYRDKLVLKSSLNSEGIVFSNNAVKKFWWEIDGNSTMVLNTLGYLGLGLNVDGTEDPQEMLHVSGNTLIGGQLTVKTVNTGTTVSILGITSGGTVIQASDFYDEICSYCSSSISGDVITSTGATEIEWVNTDDSEVVSNSPYSCTKWCYYKGGEFVGSTFNYTTALEYEKLGYVIRCCDANSSDGGTNYGIPISGITVVTGSSKPDVLIGVTRPYVVKNTRKNYFRNAYNSQIINSNQSSIVDSTLGLIELSTLSSIGTSFNSKIYNSYLSSVISSENGFVTNSGNGVIIGSQYSILSGVTGSTIIGGNNLSGFTNDTVYVPNFVVYDSKSTFGTTASGYRSHAEGKSTTASGLYSHSEGGFTTASGDGSHSEGYYTTASGVASHAEGVQTISIGQYSHAEGFLTTSIGDYSHAEGRSTTASGVYSHAEGYTTTASGYYCHAEGRETIALNPGSHAEGFQTTSVGNYSHAEGILTTASGDYSHAEGNFTTASGLYSHTEGYYTTTIGDSSHSEGYQTTASGVYSHAEGYQTKSLANNSHSEGSNTTASGNYSHAEGSFTTSLGAGSHTEGDTTTAQGSYSHAEGNLTIALGNYSHAEGIGTTASGNYSHAEGYYTTTIGDYSHAEGTQTTASGIYSHAEGFQTRSIGQYSHAEGGSTTASGVYSHAEGFQTRSIGQYSHAEGYLTRSIGNYSHTEGFGTTTSGNYSHAEGRNTTASGYYSHAEGFQTTSIGLYSHTEGNQTRSTGDHSHAEGQATTSSGNYSHAEGRQTTSIGQYSHVEGVQTTASGLYSHAEGIGTIAYEAFQHVSGRWNNTTNANQYFIIGRGTSNAARANAFRVDSAGNVYGAGATYNSGADYAEYFESLSGDTIPVGTVVELVDDKIKICEDPNNAIGVISANPTLIGNNEDGTADEWVGKYEKDEWGRFVMEDYSYQVLDYINSEGESIYKTITEKRPKLSQNFDPNITYVPRSERPEWNVVGLVGQVRILKNQQIPTRWRKMRDINNNIALYLIR